MNSLKLIRFCGQITIARSQIIRQLSTVTSQKGCESTSEPLTIKSQTGGIRTVYLNDPRNRNALSMAMLQSLYNDIKCDQDDLRVIIIKAKGPVFSTGHDLKEFTEEKGDEFHEAVINSCTKVMNLIQDVSVPVIAQVNGLATAAGCQLVASCDIAVASQKSAFSTPGINVGVFCTTPGVELSRSVPSKIAMEMLMTGDLLSAKDALLHGLVNKVVPEDQLESETMKLVNKICENSKEVVAIGKKAFYSQIALEKKTAYRFAESIMVSNLSLEDGKEGIKSFIEKRKPNWKH